METGMERQLEIYRKGLFGMPERFPVDYADLERAAKQAMKPEAYDYVAGSAGTESTAAANRRAFDDWQIVPRFLRNVSQRDWSVELFGQKLPAPVYVAPVGVQGIVHPDGELATARACAKLGIPFVLSTVSSYTIEQVAEAMGDAPRWFQLYWSRHHEVAASFVRRAEAAGYNAIVITVDTFMLAWRPRDLRHAYLPFMHGDGLANYFSDPVFRSLLAAPPEEDPGSAVMQFAAIFGNPSLTWDDLAFLRQQTKLPILLKGLLHPDDAREAVRRGVDGIIVSNHGGRQVDGAISALHALDTIAQAVGVQVPVLFDSGIRTGADALKALALGAQMVGLGRPVMWALGIGGEEGVHTYLRNFLADFDLTLALSGYKRLSEVNRESVWYMGYSSP
ncbi:MAG: alpha-hydroxy-acid oxidizing enzyme [Armatimonadetes bacterium JP3_11]|jgi:isopentenyl diphosphate isomerase/L-lactate dehydrogenase-like FMN-dependent dehydrogenase|nr:MAG: alpha-hydroxy-acid oxidizing enzyme [Armatimonadetes bacterium CP1_7O]OYT75334.1 MAG: alpha-hydroxy-acid oxidizing enzyme [Armatimonadetes bacterium JP3_11]RMH08974.1 MAG: alpha-hydroxy-acid oxidizing protein [Armatimonadota bacterium]